MPDPAELTRLYGLADSYHRLAPWEWMEEIDLIAVRLPGLEEPGFVSVMGMAGNHTALASYLGLEALERFNLMHAGADLSDGDGLRLILESRQLQASFNGRADLEKSELAEIKALGRKYRGDNWPCFRSFHPGKAPGPVTVEEAEWLGLALEQATIVAPRLRSGGFRTFRIKAGPMEILSRGPAGEPPAWQDRWMPFHRKDYEFPLPSLLQNFGKIDTLWNPRADDGKSEGRTFLHCREENRTWITLTARCFLSTGMRSEDFGDNFRSFRRVSGKKRESAFEKIVAGEGRSRLGDKLFVVMGVNMSSAMTPVIFWRLKHSETLRHSALRFLESRLY